MMLSSAESKPTAERIVRDLNEKYIDAFMKSDVEWYGLMLSEDFVCIDSDGSVLHKKEFLDQAAQGTDVAHYELEHVNVRIYGDVAIVQATGKFTRIDSSTGHSRYTDIYVRKGEEWKVVSAQITRGA